MAVSRNSESASLHILNGIGKNVKKTELLGTVLARGNTLFFKCRLDVNIGCYYDQNAYRKYSPLSTIWPRPTGQPADGQTEID
jgi:hypothetical protein